MRLRRKSSGYLLMELLIAIALVSFGLFGFAKVQLLNVATEYDLMMHIEGNMLLSEMEGFIGNPVLCPDMSGMQETNSAVNCRTQTCTREEFATFQFALWQCKVGVQPEESAICDGAGRLPRAARLSIAVEDDRAMLKLEWTGSGGLPVEISRTVNPSAQC